MKEFSAALGALMIALAAMFFGILWCGYIISILWLWFVVPVFAVPILSIAQACGLSVVAAMFKLGLKMEHDVENEKWWRRLPAAFIKPLVILFIGWCVKQFL